MANQEHLDILKQGVGVWSQWRREHPDIKPDLYHANLSGADLSHANLSGARFFVARLNRTKLVQADLSGNDLSGTNLRGAYLSGADLSRADLSYANLSHANLSGATLTGACLVRANLSRANLQEANLFEANLEGADLREANLSRADLRGANLRGAILLRTNFTDATLMDCYVYGISAWSVELKGATQKNLVITDGDEPTITVDNLEVAQFVYLLLNNPKIRDIIDTIAKKAVLILGRFTPERKAVLNTLREALRTYGYLPILLDFDKPSSQDFTETVSTLAHLSRFIIADLTDPSSIPQELYAIVPHRMVPVQPLLKESEDLDRPNREYSMFIDLRKKYHWVLSTHRYRELEDLLVSLKTKVINPAEQKAQELEKR